MREIKFRTWEYDSWMRRNKFYYYTLRDLHIARMTVGNGYNEFPHDEDSETTQYTGVKDKNGKEIYEGDILFYGFDYLTDKFDRVGYVKWSKAFSGFQFNVHNTDDSLGNDGFYGGLPSCDDCEVIGNIFENPELIE